MGLTSYSLSVATITIYGGYRGYGYVATLFRSYQSDSPTPKWEMSVRFDRWGKRNIKKYLVPVAVRARILEEIKARIKSDAIRLANDVIH